MLSFTFPGKEGAEAIAAVLQRTPIVTLGCDGQLVGCVGALMIAAEKIQKGLLYPKNQFGPLYHPKRLLYTKKKLHHPVHCLRKKKGTRPLGHAMRCFSCFPGTAMSPMIVGTFVSPRALEFSMVLESPDCGDRFARFVRPESYAPFSFVSPCLWATHSWPLERSGTCQGQRRQREAVGFRERGFILCSLGSDLEGTTAQAFSTVNENRDPCCTQGRMCVVKLSPTRAPNHRVQQVLGTVAPVLAMGEVSPDSDGCRKDNRGTRANMQMPDEAEETLCVKVLPARLNGNYWWRGSSAKLEKKRPVFGWAVGRVHNLRSVRLGPRKLGILMCSESPSDAHTQSLTQHMVNAVTFDVCRGPVPTGGSEKTALTACRARTWFRLCGVVLLQSDFGCDSGRPRISNERG